jgi:hypothetical protein
MRIYFASGTMAMRQDPDFDIEKTPMLHNAEFLLRAQDAYDADHPAKSASAPSAQAGGPAKEYGGKSRGGKGKGQDRYKPYSNGGKGKGKYDAPKQEWSNSDWKRGKGCHCNLFNVRFRLHFACAPTSGIDKHIRGTP